MERFIVQNCPDCSAKSSKIESLEAEIQSIKLTRDLALKGEHENFEEILRLRFNNKGLMESCEKHMAEIQRLKEANDAWHKQVTLMKIDLSNNELNTEIELQRQKERVGVLERSLKQLLSARESDDLDDWYWSRAEEALQSSGKDMT